MIVPLNPCELEVVCAKEERLRLEEEERFRKEEETCLQKEGGFPGSQRIKKHGQKSSFESMLCLSKALIVSLNPCELEVVCAKEERLRLEEEKRFRKEEETCLQKEGGFPGSQRIKKHDQKSSFGVHVLRC